jgi:caffeoyl-CoA O-methyltransferase
MQDLIPQLNAYCEQHGTWHDDICAALERETHLRTLAPRMLSGKLQGQFLAWMSNLLQPKFILEIGTFTGYSALCLATGLTSDGRLITIDPDAETGSIAQRFFDKSPFASQIQFIIDDAKIVIPTLDFAWDLVFIDADKSAYPEYLDLVIPSCKKGAVIIVDNVLWSGKVLDVKMDKKTAAIDAFNKKVKQDARIEAVILPIRDGITMIRVL